MEPPKGPVRWLYLLGIGGPEPDESASWEVEHHLREVADNLVAAGWEPEEARSEAERRFGDVRRYRPAMRRLERRRMVRARWGRRWDVARQSLASAARSARRYPGFTAGVVVTLALGIAANGTMYGIVDRLLLRAPEHIVEPEDVRRVFVWRPSPFTGEMSTQAVLAYADFEDLKAHSGMSVAAYAYDGEQTLAGREGAVRAQTVLATAELFPLLGVQPRLGRFYAEEEAGVGAPLTVVLSEELWRRAYGADPSILGRSVDLGDHRAAVVGVAPAGFTGMDLQPVDIWLPLEATASREWASCLTGRNCARIYAAARVHDGVSIEAAEAEATRLHRNGRRQEVALGRYSDTARVSLEPVIAAAGPRPSRESRVARWLMGVSLIVLLIACANVANLLMARGTRQRRETAVRLALGVGRGRLTAQAVVESVTFALVGGAVALGVARWGGGLLRSTLLPGVSFTDAGINGRSITFIIAIAVLAGLVASIGPALQATRSDLLSDLSDAGRGVSRPRSTLRSSLTVFQAAMSVVLLVGAGLFARSLGELRGLDIGFDTDRLLVAELEIAGGELELEARSEAYAEAMRRVAALPEIESVVATATPLGFSYAVDLRVPGLDSLPFSSGGPYVFTVTPGYFETAGLVITSGRPIDATDGPDAPRVAVVSETMARNLWPGEQPLGRCLMVGSEPDGCTTVVGVVEDATRGGYRSSPYMGYYLAMAQVETAMGQGRYLSTPNALYARARGDARTAQAAMAAALRSGLPRVRWAHVQTLREYLDPEARSWALGATMFSVFGLLALILAAVGLYSVLAFDVAQRTRELGIRTALGARRARLLGAVLYQGGRFALVGVAVGLAVAYTAAPYAQDLLFEVSPRDPRVLGSVCVVLLVVSVAASLIPGLRATRVDPVAALRTD